MFLQNDIMTLLQKYKNSVKICFEIYLIRKSLAYNKSKINDLCKIGSQFLFLILMYNFIHGFSSMVKTQIPDIINSEITNMLNVKDYFIELVHKKRLTQ